MNTVNDFILHLGIFTNIIIVYILFKKWKDAFHYRILVIFFLWVLVALFCFYGYLNKHSIIFYATFLAFDTISIVLGPLFYIYIKAKFLRKRHMSKRDILHFIIPFLYLVFVSLPKLLHSIHHPKVFEHLRVGLENLFALNNIYSMVYLVMTYRILKKIDRASPHHKSYEGDDAKWFMKLMYSMTIIIVIDNVITIFEVTYGDIQEAVSIVSFVGLFLMIYLTYHGVFRTRVLLPEFLFKEDGAYIKRKHPEQQDALPVLQKKQLFSTAEMHRLQQDLDRLMAQYPWYLDAEFSLGFLAEKLNITDKKLSYLLNQHIGISFNDYTNHFRVEEVKARLKDSSNANYTILAIALDCGFNSKTSFNRIFNKVTGTTPSEYRKQSFK